MSAPRLLLCAPASGGGKTTVTCALLQALVNRGAGPVAFKCGPDYIDPMFHSEIIGAKSRNLDLFFLGRDTARYLLEKNSRGSGLALIEGVMGYYDGIGLSADASAYDLARATGTPAVLVLDGRGRALTAAAAVKGMRDFRPDSGIRGVILNRVSPMLYPRLKEAIEGETGVTVYGYLPNLPGCALESRHLGLVTAAEVAGLREKLSALAAQAEKSVDIDGLLALAASAPALDAAAPALPPPVEGRPRIAVARDKAFCFYYADGLELLETLGAELAEFSPLADESLPEGACGLYLGGGYPETFAGRLESNEAMRNAILEFAKNGGEIFAECGGYMYLCKELALPDGTSRNMCGVIDGTARMGEKLRSLGYREAVMETGAPFGLPFTRIRGHEFHWSRIELNRPYPPLYTVTDKNGNKSREGVADGNVKAGYIHLYWGTETPDHPQEPQPGLGRVILLNGASSAGKSTLARTLHRLMEEDSMIFSMDDYLAMSRGRHENALDAVRETGLPFIESFHAAIAEAARKGALVIVDHVIGESRAWVQDLLNRLSGIPRALIKVDCREDILLERERNRTDRTPDPAHAERQYGCIHQNFPHDFSIDTSEATPRECAQKLMEQLPPEFRATQE